MHNYDDEAVLSTQTDAAEQPQRQWRGSSPRPTQEASEDGAGAGEADERGDGR